MYQQNVVLTAEIDDFGVELGVPMLPTGLAGRLTSMSLALQGVLRDGGDVGQEVVLLRQLVVPRLGTAQLGPVIKTG